MFILDFIKTYWFIILPGVEVLCTLIIVLLRKKPVKVVDTLKEVIVRVLPSLINMAEATGLKGSDKLKWLMDELVKVLKDLNYGDDVIGQYLPFATEQVELILSTPKRK